MKLIPWRNKSQERGGSPAGALARMRQDMDDLLQRVRHDPFSAASTAWPMGGDFPKMDMSERDDEVTLKFELPGVTAEEVDISVSGNVLTLKGEKSESRSEKEGDCTYSERSFGSFMRSVQLPATVNAEKVDASYKDGVLTVKLAKRPEAKAKKVVVRKA